MTIYVDHPIQTHRGKWWCHMIADGGVEELHAFAQKIGLSRRGAHTLRKRPHYDLAPTFRAKAVQHGAIEVTSRDIIRILRGER